MTLTARTSAAAFVGGLNASSRTETEHPPATGARTLLSLAAEYRAGGSVSDFGFEPQDSPEESLLASSSSTDFLSEPAALRAISPVSPTDRPAAPRRLTLLEFAARNRTLELPASEGVSDLASGEGGSSTSLSSSTPDWNPAACWKPPLKIEVPKKRWELKADKKVWKTTYWPYCATQFGEPGGIEGNPEVHLWAKNGCLDKLDQLLEKRGREPGARAHELVPALNFLKNDGSPSGYYLPVSTIREADAERTTGVDFTGDGKLNDNVKVDFLDDRRDFGHNGRTNGRLYVGWWGSCDKVALAGLLFSDPKRAVTLEGITFSPQDIRGLLTVIADSQAPLHEYVGTRFSGAPDRLVHKDGTVYYGRASNISTEECLRGEFERRNGNRILVRQLRSEGSHVRFKSGDKENFFPVEDVVSLEREDAAEPSASDFHQTVKRWLRENRPFGMDRSAKEEVWNVNVDEAVVTKTRGLSPWGPVLSGVGFNGRRGDRDVCFYDATLWANRKVVRSYRYWIEKRDGEHINSGWNNDNPGLLWRPLISSAAPEGTNKRNPFVDPALVREIYEESIRPDSEE